MEITEQDLKAAHSVYACMALTAAQEFVSQHPEYFPCAANLELFTQFFQDRCLDPLQLRSYELAYSALAGSLAHKPGPKARLIEYSDAFGSLFVVKYTSALRVSVEVNPEANEERVYAKMQEVFPEAAKAAGAQGFSEIVFQSSGPKPLLEFAKEQFGFEKTETYRRVLGGE